MKKKLSFIIAAVLFAACSLGCSGSDSAPSFDTSKPWQQPGHERCEYSVVKTYVGGKGDDVVVAEGTYTTELTTNGENTEVVNKFELTYNSEPEAVTEDTRGKRIINLGLTDGYEGGVTFKRDSLIPVNAYKNYSIAQRPLCDDEYGVAPVGEKTESPEEGVAYRYMLADKDKYGDPRGYEYTVDYSANTAHFVTYEGETKSTDTDGGKVYYRDYKKHEEDISVSGSIKYDNEQIMYLVRALSATEKGGSATFYLSNIYDSYRDGDYVRYTMSMSCKDKRTDYVPEFDPQKYLLEDTEAELVKTPEGKYSVPCIEASVSISSSTPGPAITFIVTDPSVTLTERNEYGNKTNKVIVQMTYYEYSPGAAKIAYSTVYTLKSYSTTFGIR